MGDKEVKEIDTSYLEMGKFSYGHIKRVGKGGKIRVGNFTSISSDVKAIMVGHNVNWVSTFPFTSREMREHFKKGYPKNITGHPKWYQDILIGSDVWIGYGVTLMGGIIINDGAVIGAGSVVTHDVQPYAIEMGNPSKTYRKRFADSHIEFLMNIKWWEWDNDKIEQNLDVLCNDDIEAFFRRHYK